jgi:hypothetical protein
MVDTVPSQHLILCGADDTTKDLPAPDGAGRARGRGGRKDKTQRVKQ